MHFLNVSWLDPTPPGSSLNTMIILHPLIVPCLPLRFTAPPDCPMHPLFVPCIHYLYPALPGSSRHPLLVFFIFVKLSFLSIKKEKSFLYIFYIRGGAGVHKSCSRKIPEWMKNVYKFLYINIFHSFIWLNCMQGRFWTLRLVRPVCVCGVCVSVCIHGLYISLKTKFIRLDHCIEDQLISVSW